MKGEDQILSIIVLGVAAYFLYSHFTHPSTQSTSTITPQTYAGAQGSASTPPGTYAGDPGTPIVSG